MMEQKLNSQSIAIERFHARRFKTKAGQSAEKHAILKVTSTGSNKKQKIPIEGTCERILKRLDGGGRS
jgi:hypothetical protein